VTRDPQSEVDVVGQMMTQDPTQVHLVDLARRDASTDLADPRPVRRLAPACDCRPTPTGASVTRAKRTHLTSPSKVTTNGPEPVLVQALDVVDDVDHIAGPPTAEACVAHGQMINGLGLTLAQRGSALAPRWLRVGSAWPQGSQGLPAAGVITRAWLTQRA
jgi:hypothetical protein